jgi:hypothetical protein
MSKINTVYVGWNFIAWDFGKVTVCNEIKVENFIFTRQWRAAVSGTLFSFVLEVKPM